MSEMRVDILRERWPYLVVLKPPGLLTQAPPGIDCLEIRLKTYLRQRDDGSDEPYLGVPHRLDRPASGVMVFGGTRRATRRLSDQFERREVKKIYWALVEGAVDPPEGTWTDRMRKIPGRGQAELVPPDHPDGRTAVLHYQARSVGSWGTWLEIELETGRTHQIRLQAASRGHPVLGDGQYGSKVPFGEQYEELRLRAIALHARELTFFDSTSRETISTIAPVSADWQNLIHATGFKERKSSDGPPCEPLH